MVERPVGWTHRGWLTIGLPPNDAHQGEHGGMHCSTKLGGSLGFTAFCIILIDITDGANLPSDLPAASGHRRPRPQAFCGLLHRGVAVLSTEPLGALRALAPEMYLICQACVNTRYGGVYSCMVAWHRH